MEIQRRRVSTSAGISTTLAGCLEGFKFSFLRENPTMAEKVKAPIVPALPNTTSTVSLPAGRAGAQPSQT